MAKTKRKRRLEKKNKEEGRKMLFTILGVTAGVIILLYLLFSSVSG